MRTSFLGLHHWSRWRIAQVLPGKATAADATVVDLSGQTCMPGWIDLHVHLNGESNPKAYEEVTLTRKVSCVMKDGTIYAGGGPRS